MSKGLPDPNFWRDKRVLLTGHTGFKGGWMAAWLHRLGARITGLALAPETPSLFALARLEPLVAHRIVDIRDHAAVSKVIAEARPEIVIHMAAQSLVRRSYREPVATFAVNVMGTAHLLDAVNATGGVAVVLTVTSDKVYANDEKGRAFVETDRLGGLDPYSASKVATETVTSSYAHAFLEPAGVRVATVRGGNVIGGGDFSEDRIVPDIWRAVEAHRPLALRHPGAVRPWQHVLDCLCGYLIYAQALADDPKVPRTLNIGPLRQDHMTVAEIAGAMLASLAPGLGWLLDEGPKPKEMHTLSLDAGCAARALGFRDRLPKEAALQWTADWYRTMQRGYDMRSITFTQIDDFRNL